MALKKHYTFDELVRENREKILTDSYLLEQIEDKLEEKHRYTQQKAE